MTSPLDQALQSGDNPYAKGKDKVPKINNSFQKPIAEPERQEKVALALIESTAGGFGLSHQDAENMIQPEVLERLRKKGLVARSTRWPHGWFRTNKRWQ